MRSSKWMSFRTLVIAATFAAAVSSTLTAQPAYAGHWSLTGAPTGGIVYSPSGGSSTLTTTTTVNSMTTGTGIGGGSAKMTGDIKYTGTITWVPASSNDPAPATVKITEYSYSSAEAGFGGTYTTAADDGLGDGSTTTRTSGYPGTSQTTTSGSQTVAHIYSVSVPSGGHYTLTRHITNLASGGLFSSGNMQYKVSIQ